MERKLISKEEWVIRLMQGMIGDYGNSKTRPAECYYYMGKFYIDYDSEQIHFMDLNNMHPASDFWITNEKGIPLEELSILNIKEKS